MKYNSKISFETSALVIAVAYERSVTKQDEAHIKATYQRLFSAKAGRNIPKEEIKVSPATNETMELTTHFSVRLGKPLYVGLPLLHQKAPYVLPRLIQNLKKYPTKSLQEPQIRLIRYAIAGLEEIVNQTVEEDNPWLHGTSGGLEIE